MSQHMTWLLNNIILGEFKWTLLGSLLTLLALFMAQLLGRWHKRRWLTALTARVVALEDWQARVRA